ncbi:aflatoxin B1 aldehyde reductase member 2-like isoform X2 [Corticium candelabrum]|uniref:aflatoxin B1 aldehyde reductase member 2-like isoform X2 n=1 Tax=Corticium candelabrum TaxID=121492 RepID=UPI002E25F9EF|nr:aflatoxin B1 aldehyde reductase member 2-like isoform X2 [Corticium candelabrum]
MVLQSSQVLELFLQSGFNELDTARMYSNGQSEKIIGNLPAEFRNKFTIATKANPIPPNSLRRDSLTDQTNLSLQCLQKQSVDILYLHMPDHNTPIKETLEACQQLYVEGKFKELGLSNYAAWEVVEAYYICKQNGWVVPTVYQGMYNGITREVEEELFPAIRHLGMRFYAYNPLAGGLLTGKYKFEAAQEPDRQPVSRFFGTGGTWAKTYRNRYWNEAYFGAIQLIHNSLKKTYGTHQDGSLKVSLVDAAIRWLKWHSKLSAEQGDGIILGTTSLKQTKEDLDAYLGGPLDADVVGVFDEAWQMTKAFCPHYFR